MTKVLVFVFSMALFGIVLAQEASALRGAGIRAGGVGVGGYRGALRARNVGYRAGAWGGRRNWRGGRALGYGVGLGVLAGGYYPYYGYGYSSYGYGGYPAYAGGYGYSSGMGESGATTEKVAATGPGTCGTYLYWKDGKCNDARSK
jgi:hypothetical protein